VCDIGLTFLAGRSSFGESPSKTSLARKGGRSLLTLCRRRWTATILSTPWKIFTDEQTEDGVKERIYVQVTREVGKVQPVHWDTAPWYQCLAFHAGEQPHAGTSWHGDIDADFQARVVVYFFAVPEAVYERVRDLELFNSEFPFGLVDPIFDKQV